MTSHSDYEIQYKRKPKDWIALTIKLTEMESVSVITQLEKSKKQYAIQVFDDRHVVVWTGKY